MWPWINDCNLWLSAAIALVAQHPDLALVVAFLAAVIEALAVVGTIIPGTVIVMGVAGAGAAAGQPMWPILLMAIAGAVIGDFVSYWVGYRFRFRVRQWWPLATRPYLMAYAARFFERYGSYSVALCRFIPVLRSLVPLVAGIAGMAPRRFLIANVISALAWAPAHVWPAQLAGMSVERLRAGEWQSAACLAAGVVIFAVVLWMLHRRLTPRLIAARR